MKKILDFMIILFAVIGVISFASTVTDKMNQPSDKPETDVTEETDVDFSQLRYLAFGDSITAGDGLADRNDSYPCVVGKILGCKVTNKGYGGSTLAYYSERRCVANEVISVANGTGRYQIISCTGGINDKSWGLPLGTINDKTNETIYGSLYLIATTLKTNYPDAFIFFITPIKNPSSEVDCKAGYNLEDISNAIKEVAAKYDIPVLDLYNTSQFETVDCGMNNEKCDGTHPLKEFVAEYMAPQIAQYIKDNYR